MYEKIKNMNMKIPSLEINCKTKGQLRFSLSMQQSVHILQMPMIDLAGWIENYIDQNPLIERLENPAYQGSLSCAYPFFEDNFASCPTLFEYLMDQVKLSFAVEDRSFAELIIGNLDEKGFLTMNLEEMASEYNLPIETLQNILKKVQELDPPGIAASSLQESLLIQLKEECSSIAYSIIKDHFDDLLYHRQSHLRKTLKCSVEELEDAVQLISTLTPYPGIKFNKKVTPVIYPDVTLKKEDDLWMIQIHDEIIPAFQIKTTPKDLSAEDKKSVKEHLNSAKWLLDVLSKRKSSLFKLTQYLLKKHLFFFEEKSPYLEPIRMGQAALDLGWHPSTLSRAVSEKYISTPSGVFPIKKFFNSSIQEVDEKEISNQTIKEMLRKIIKDEDSKCPMSDQELAQKLKMAGISCSRRTVAKYRTSLGILAAYQRKIE